MKYAVFSTYRTASTLMHEIIRNHFGITDFGELTGQIPVDKRSNETLRHAWLAEKLALPDYVVKLFAYDFTIAGYYFNRTTFDWSIFDKIILSTRANVTDQMCSVYYMKPWLPPSDETHPFPADPTPEAIDFTNTGWNAQLERQRNGLLRFHEMKTELLNNFPTKVCIVPSEIFSDPQETYLPILNSLTGIEFVASDFSPISPNTTGLNYREKYTNYDDLKAITDSWGLPT